MTRAGIITALAVTLIGGCKPWGDGRGSLTGAVVDTFGRPLKAAVQVEGLAAAAHTGGDGRYVLAYVPGSFTVRYEAPGHQLALRPWDLFEAAHVEVETVALTPLPPGPGLWVPTPESLIPLSPTGLAFEGPIGGARKIVALGPSSPICAGQPLLGEWAGSRPSMPFRAWHASAEGEVWIDPDDTRDGVELALSPLGDRGWAITPAVEGRLLLLGDSPTAIRRLDAYLVEFSPCEEAPR